MAILKPADISPSNISLDATQQIVVSWKNYGDRQYYYQLKIYKNNDNSLVLDTGKITSFNSFHVINAGTLTNGIQYKYQITVWNQLNESATSEWILFKCSSTPVCSFTNLSPTILNSSYVFQGTYNQAENVPIKSWQMILYNSYDEIIGTSPIIYSPIIEYEFGGFSNERNYKIELQVYSQDNLLGTTGKIPFYVRYEVPKSALSLRAENVKELAAVRLLWNTVQIIGKSDGAFIDNEKLDVTNGRKVYFDEGFNINGNFTLKIWLESVTNYNLNINYNAQIVSYNLPLTDTTIIWLENPLQTTELPLKVVVSSQPPETADVLWIENVKFAMPKELKKVVCDIYPPVDTNALWIDLSISIGDKLEILKMKNNNNEDISVRYFNNAFHLYKNNELISSIGASGNKYYLCIQQINDSLTFHAEVVS